MGLTRVRAGKKEGASGKRACSLTLAAMLIASQLVAFGMLTFAPEAAAGGVEPAIKGGEHHSLALRSDGTVWGWGLCDRLISEIKRRVSPKLT